jgi:hypothetical protein
MGVMENNIKFLTQSPELKFQSKRLHGICFINRAKQHMLITTKQCKKHSKAKTPTFFLAATSK